MSAQITHNSDPKADEKVLDTGARRGILLEMKTTGTMKSCTRWISSRQDTSSTTKVSLAISLAQKAVQWTMLTFQCEQHLLKS